MTAMWQRWRDERRRRRDLAAEVARLTDELAERDRLVFELGRKLERARLWRDMLALAQADADRYAAKLVALGETVPPLIDGNEVPAGWPQVGK